MLSDTRNMYIHVHRKGVGLVTDLVPADTGRHGYIAIRMRGHALRYPPAR